jgi:hypothetical protein
MLDCLGTGFVDGHCELFGIRKLYVPGSSSFRVPDSADPTPTNVAMSVRLTSQCKMELRSE